MPNLTIVRHSVAAALAGVIISLAGAAFADVVGLNNVDPDGKFSRVWRIYPDMDATYARDGTPRKIQQIRSIKIGASKQQLVKLAGQPVSASQDGAWNFNLRLKLEQKNQLVCQFKVYFDENQHVSGTLWRRPQCADIVRSQRK